MRKLQFLIPPPGSPAKSKEAPSISISLILSLSQFHQSPPPPQPPPFSQHPKTKPAQQPTTHKNLHPRPSHSPSPHPPAQLSLMVQFKEMGTREFEFSEPGPGGSKVITPYHTYSPSAVGMAVFVNYGREEDYRALRGLGVDVSRRVVVARRGGGMSRGGAVRKAEEKGAAGVLLYTEGEYVKGVERRTVMKGLGDPFTPGWAGVVEGGERLGREESEVVRRFPKIPSISKP